MTRTLGFLDIIGKHIEGSPEYRAVEEALAKQAVSILHVNGFNGRTVELIQELADDATRKARANNVLFPDIVVVYFLGAQKIKLWDRDASHKRKQQYIVTCAREGMDAGDIVDGMRRAWPDYKPHVEEKKAALKRKLQ